MTLRAASRPWMSPMANDKHVAILKNGAASWNAWRDENPNIRPDLTEATLLRAELYRANLTGAGLIGANLRGADLEKADLRGADLKGATLRWARLYCANLIRASLIRTNLGGVDLREADLCAANLEGADLSEANLSKANFRKANLRGADLQRATLVETDLTAADLTGCRIYGVSAWGLKLDGAKQHNLIMTRAEPAITVDNIEVAQFIYLMLHNPKIRDVIDTITSKAVLILGRFTDGRIAILERLREELRKRNFLPIVFNFDKPEATDYTETVRLLAGMSRFVIADITKPKSTPLELQATIPERMIPFATIIEDGETPFAMFQDLWIKHKGWVFPPIAYFFRGRANTLARQRHHRSR
jgi:hypothetical protein